MASPSRNQHSSSRSRRSRVRPAYMLLFTELLRKHNEQQPRFGPARPTAEPIVPPPPLTLAAADQLNKRLVQLLADNSRRPSRSSTPSNANNRPASLASDPQATTGAPTNELSQGSQHDLLSTTNSRATTGGISSLHTKQVSGTHTAARNTTSEQYNTPQQSEEQPIKAVKLLGIDATGASCQAQPGNQASPQLEGQLERLKLEEISELLNQQRRRTLEQLQQLQPDQQSASTREHSLRQAEEKSSNNQSNSERSLRAVEKSLKIMVSPPASPATRPVRTAAMNVAAKVVLTKATKDSNAPSLAQTPTAAVGGSSLVNQNNAQAANQRNQKKISISKIIAEQTPNAFKTFVNVKNPGEHSGPGKTGAPTNTNGSAMDTVPSDYEHIFHFPSSMVDDRATKVKYHEKKPDRQADNRPHQATPPPAVVHPPPVKIVKNLALKQNKKPKRQGGRNHDNNKKAK